MMWRESSSGWRGMLRLAVLAGVGGVALTMAVACVSGCEIASVDVSPAEWREPVMITYHNRDTLSVRQMVMIMRHDVDATRIGRYMVEATSPSGLKTRDNIRVDIDHARTNRLRYPTGGLEEVEVPVRKRTILSESGDYTFTIAPLQKVRGVWSVAMEWRRAQ